MKKLLVTILVIGSTSIAYAQTNTTVYGRVDVGFIGSNYKGVGINPRATQNTAGFGSSGESPSLLGLKITEDLGGGNRATAIVETGLNPNSGSLGTFNNRQSYVGLGKAGIGDVRIGTQYTPMFVEQLVSGAGRANGQVGDVIWPGSPQTNGNQGSNQFGLTNSATVVSDGQPYHTTNTLTFKSEKIGGFAGTAFYTMNNQTTTTVTTPAGTTGGTNNSTGFGLNANYTYSKFYGTVVYQSFKNTQPGTLLNPVPAPYTANGPGVNTTDNSLYASGSYDFGPVTGYLQWINHKVTSTINSNYWANRSAQQIGVRGWWNPTVESWASIGSGKSTGFGISQPTANFIGWQVGTNYWLSKRTNLYGIYGQTNVSSASTNPSLFANSYAVGVRHAF